MPVHPASDPRDVLSDWFTAFNARDLDRICALYAEDAVLWGTFSAGLIASPGAVRDYFVRAFERGLQANADLQAVLVQSIGPAAIASGSFGLASDLDGQRRVLPARFSIVLVPSGGAWMIANHHSSLMPG